MAHPNGQSMAKIGHDSSRKIGFADPNQATSLDEGHGISGPNRRVRRRYPRAEEVPLQLHVGAHLYLESGSGHHSLASRNG